VVIYFQKPSRQSRLHYIKAVAVLQYELYKEGVSEVDVTTSCKEGIIFIETKYLVPELGQWGPHR
jgi:hypothetical protein